MEKKSSISIGLQLELLEDRTLLASDVPYSASDVSGIVPEITWLNAAVEAESSVEYDLVWFPSDSQLVLNGDETGSLVVNVDYLPNNVKSITTSAFKDVKLVGTRGFDRLHASDLDNLTVDVSLHKTLVMNNVDSLQISEPAPFTFLEGDETFLEVEDLSNTYIYTDLENLNLEIKNPESTLWVLSLNPEQTVSSNFVPENFNLIGLENSQLYILGEESNISDSDIDTLDSLLAEYRLFEIQEFEGNEGNEGFLGSIYLSNLGTLTEDVSNSETEIFGTFGNMVGRDTAVDDVLRTEKGKLDENSQIEEKSIKETVLWVYDLDNFYDSNAWLPEEYSADNIEFNTHNDDLINWDEYSPFDYEGSKGKERIDEVKAELTWGDKMQLILNQYFTRTNNTQISLADHFALRVEDEFTPGERSGLIVDTKMPSRNSFTQPKNA